MRAESIVSVRTLVSMDDAKEEINDVYPPHSTTITTQFRDAVKIPEADRGKAAWLLLLACFVVETVIWGMPSAYGTFLQFYDVRGVGKDGNMSDSALLPLVGSFSSGLMYLFGPPVAWLVNPRPKWRVPAIRIGSIICVLALLLSSFANTSWQLLMTQGFLYSIGGSLASYPTISLIAEWFVQRRGLAAGIIFSGTSVGGLVYPFILNFLLQRYEGAVTLQILAGSTFILLAVSVPFLRPRLPETQSASELSSQREHVGPKIQFWKNRRLMLFQLANLFQSFGFFVPMLYLPLFATSIGLSSDIGSITLSLVNGASLFSRIGIGMLSDRISPHSLASWTLLASTFSVAIIWGVASTTIAPLLVFSVVLGLVSGGWTNLYPVIAQDVAKEDPQVASTVFAVSCCVRGVASLLVAPVSTFLLKHPLKAISSSTAYGINDGSYGSLLLSSSLTYLIATGIEGFATFRKR